MEHYNPLLKHNHSPKKFFAIGGDYAAPDTAEL